MVRTAIVAAVALGFASPLSATEGQFVNGHDVLDSCTADRSSPALPMCLGYIEGLLRRDDLVRLLTPKYAYACKIPETVTRAQVLDIVVTYLRENPDKHQWDGARVTLGAIREALCKKD